MADPLPDLRELLFADLPPLTVLEQFGSAPDLHELAAAVDALNASTAGESRIVSLVASRTEAGDEGPRCSYKIVPGPLLGCSYAREIAAQYGISYDQLTALLQQRGMIE